MRKRTQLVGFEMGYWKHVQYCAEFIDNALDAIESFQWNELKKHDLNIAFPLDRDVEIQNLSLRKNHSGSKEINVTEDESGEILDEDQIELEAEVQKIIDDMEEILLPLGTLIDLEPIVIIRLRETEASTILTSELGKKNVMNFSFEIFDNGTGMSKTDLRRYGKYLASSKSVELKQTRGSQGFGSPSAFSDAQNTTGKPIIVVSKSADSIYAVVSEFFTTSKNEKKYLVHPTEIDSPFLHGTYIKLNYLNVKYVRGYVETYIKENAFLNPHVTLIYLDPMGEEWIYPRLVSTFPIEPKYAKPHPSSTNIGDLQDLLTKSNNLTVSAFLQENFVRISSNTAKEILEIASKDLQDKLNIFALKNGYLIKVLKKTDNIYYMQNEKRVYGKSSKPRDKIVIYELESNDLKNEYWECITIYDQLIKEKEKIDKKIKKNIDLIEKTEIKKEITTIEKDNKILLQNIDEITKKKEKLKNELDALIQKNFSNLVEVKNLKHESDLEELINNVEISKSNPTNLTNDQFNSLFLAFKSVKYMSPPTNTAIPVGSSVLENSLTKELGLKLSENPEDFDNPVEKLYQTSSILQNIKREYLVAHNEIVDDGMLDHILPYPEEVEDLNKKLLNVIDIYEDSDEIKQYTQKLLEISSNDTISQYKEIFDYFTENFSKDDDFIAAETRDPTSGKGLAYVVEAVMAYSNKLEVPKRSRDVLSRFVNRTPKLRDSADCAITNAVQSVNWKNYKLDVYDNNLPKGPIKLLVNVSGPFVHLMFKSQSKNALAEDENLEKEIKFCLEAIGRKLRIYLNRKASFHQSQKRANLIEKYIPKFTKSLHNIATQGGRFKDKIKQEELEKLIKDAIGKKTPVITPVISKTELEPPIDVFPIENVDINNEEEIEELGNIVSEPIPPPELEVISSTSIENEKIQSQRIKAKKPKEPIPEKVKKEKLTIKETKEIPIHSEIARSKIPKLKQEDIHKSIQTQLPLVTTEKILRALSTDWLNIKDLIFKMKVKDMMDARFLQVKLKDLERKGQVLMDVKMGKKHWKLP